MDVSSLRMAGDTWLWLVSTCSVRRVRRQKVAVAPEAVALDDRATEVARTDRHRGIGKGKGIAVMEAVSCLHHPFGQGPLWNMAVVAYGGMVVVAGLPVL